MEHLSVYLSVRLSDHLMVVTFLLKTYRLCIFVEGKLPINVNFLSDVHGPFMVRIADGTFIGLFIGPFIGPFDGCYVEGPFYVTIYVPWYNKNVRIHPNRPHMREAAKNTLNCQKFR